MWYFFSCKGKVSSAKYMFFGKTKVGIVVCEIIMKSDGISVVSAEMKPAETTEYKRLEILNSYDMKLFLHPEK